MPVGIANSAPECVRRCTAFPPLQQFPVSQALTPNGRRGSGLGGPVARMSRVSSTDTETGHQGCEAGEVCTPLLLAIAPIIALVKPDSWLAPDLPVTGRAAAAGTGHVGSTLPSVRRYHLKHCQ